MKLHGMDSGTEGHSRTAVNGLAQFIMRSAVLTLLLSLGPLSLAWLHWKGRGRLCIHLIAS